MANKLTIAHGLTDQAVNDTAATNEDTAITISVLANDTPNGQTKSLYSVSQNGTDVVTRATTLLGATVTINADGTVRYDPISAAAIQALAQGETATDSFVYTLETTTPSDAQAHLSQATVTVNLTGVNDPPVIQDNTPNGQQSTTDTNPVHPFSAVSVNDVDHNAQDSATITFSNSANGTLSGTGVTATNTPGVYTIAATSPSVLSSELNNVTFTPTTPPAGGSTTTNLSLSVSDGIAAPVTDTGISVVDNSTVSAYTPTEHVYSATLENSDPSIVGNGMRIDASHTGILEYDASDISANIGSHPITSAVLDLDQIQFGTAGGTSSFVLAIYAFSGTGSLTTDLPFTTDLLQSGKLVGTAALGSFNTDIISTGLDPAALNALLSHGSDIGLALLAVNPGGSYAGLDITGGGFAAPSLLHLTA